MSLPPLKFLVVEDEAILAMDIEAMIAEAGHTVIGEANSFKAAEALPTEIVPDIALVDLHLAGGSNGIDVSGLIQRRWPKAVIVFVTANPSEVPADFAGSYGIVAKPFSHSSFMSMIAYVCEGVQDPPPAEKIPHSLLLSPKAKSSWS